MAVRRASDIIDLSRNEAPSSPDSPGFRRAVRRALGNVHRYPIDMLNEIETDLARRFARGDRIALLTRGVDDAVDALLESKRNLIPFVYTPTFEGYMQRFSAHSRDYESQNLGPGFAFPSDHSRLSQRHLLFFANPNNPTGTLWSDVAVARLAAQVGVLVVDETYLDFAPASSFESSAGENTFVFRSFSKAYSLAGARLGLLIGARDEIQRLRRSRIFCPIDVFSLQIMRELVENDRSIAAVVEMVKQNKRYAMRVLRAADYEIAPTYGNFLLVRTIDAAQAACFLRSRGILVRDTERDGMPGWLRITVGTRAQMEILCTTLKEYQLPNKAPRSSRMASTTF